MRYLITFLLLFFWGISSGQVDKKFWFVAPEVSNDHGDDPIYLNISTFDQPATVTISMPANEADFPPITRTIAANSFHQEDLTSFLSEIEHKFRTDYDLSIPGKSNQGILIESDQEITVYYESAYSNNSDLFSLKGKNALGSEFYTPFQTRYYNNSGGNWNDPAYSAFDIVFTEDNTYITLAIPSGKAVYNGMTGWTGTVRLGPFDRGETFSGIPKWISTHKPNRNSNDDFGRVAEDHLAGVHIKAHDISGSKLRRIAITIKDGSMRGYMGSAYDLGGDQIVPLDIIGKEYIAMKGQLRSGNVGNHYSKPPAPNWARQEVVFILATEDNTNVSIQGSLVATINEGETYTRELEDDFTHIETNHPVYLWQVTGFGDEMGAAILPAIDRCTGSNKVAFSRSIRNWDFYMNILVRDGAENGFLLNGTYNSILDGSKFKNVTGTGKWKAARIGPVHKNTIKELRQSIIENTDGVFHLGIIMGDNAGCRIGFFSGFGDIPIIDSSAEISGIALCAGNMKLEVTEGSYSVFQWYRNNQPIPGANDPEYLVTEPGRYKVTAITNCNGINTETFPSNEIDAVPCLNIKDYTAGEGDPNATITVQLSHPFPGQDISFDFETFNATAEKGKDYVYTRSSGIIPAGNTETTISIPLLQDFINEPDEDFLIRISNSFHATISDSLAVCTITDDGDPEPTLSINDTIQIQENISGGVYKLRAQLSEVSGYPVEFDYSVMDGAAINGQDYSLTPAGSIIIPAGSLYKEIEISVLNDNIYEPSADGYESFNVMLKNVLHASDGNLSSEIQIIDDEVQPTVNFTTTSTAEGDSLPITITISGLCSEEILMKYISEDASAQREDDFVFPADTQSLIIPAGNLSKVLKIFLKDDNISEGPEEFLIHFMDFQYSQPPSDPYTVTNTILDADGTPQLYIEDAVATEGEDITIGIKLSPVSSEDISFEFYTQDNTAKHLQDYTGAPSPVNKILPAGDNLLEVIIPSIQDTDEEGDETFSAFVQNVSSGATLLDDEALITIKDDDEQPVAQDDSYTLSEDITSPLTGNVLDNDLGLGDQPLSLSILVQPQNGSATIQNDGNFTYLPNSNYFGTDSIIYQIEDADNDTDQAVVIFHVEAENDIPEANDDAFGPVKEKTHPSYTPLTGNLLTNDSGIGDTVSIIFISNPVKGSISIQEDGSFSYEPGDQKFGTDQFSYKLKDLDNEESGTAIVTIDIEYYNDAAPVANDDSYSTPENTPVDLSVLDNDSDLDGNNTIDQGSVVVIDPPQHGTVNLDIYSGVLTYQPDNDYYGPDQFTYQVSDKKIEDEPIKTSAKATVSIEVTTDNTNPVAQCHDTTLYLDKGGKAILYPSGIDKGSYDPDGDSVTFKIDGLSSIQYDCPGIGSYDVTLTVTDSKNAQSSCTAKVFVVDSIRPVITFCPNDTTVYCAPSSPGKNVTYSQPLFSDNCTGSNLTGSLIEGSAPGSSFPVGNTRVAYILTDGSGNTSDTCSFNIRVVADNTNPVITCPGNQTLRVNKLSNQFVVPDESLDASATDNYKVSSLNHNVSGGGTSLKNVAIDTGKHTIIWTATDAFGNTSSCSYKITVLERFDVNLSAEDGFEICDGDVLIINTSVTNGKAPFQYTYKKNGVIVSGASATNSFTYNGLTDADTLSVEVTDADGYKVTSAKNIVTVIPNPPPNNIHIID